MICNAPSMSSPGLAEDSCVSQRGTFGIAVTVSSFHGSGPRVHQKIKQKGTQWTASDDAIRSCKVSSNVACHDKPPAQRAVRAT